MLDDGVKQAFISEHFFYEVQMLRWAFNRLVENDFPQEETVKEYYKNILIGAFCMHARNLNEFFLLDKPELKNGNACALHFVDHSCDTFQKLGNALLAKLNNAASHMGYRRTTESEKVRPEDINAINQHIENQIFQFINHLPVAYGKVLLKLSATST